MRSILLLLLCAATFSQAIAASIPAHFRSVSVKVNPSKVKVFGVDTFLHWSRFPNAAEINNEVVPSFDSGYTHTGYLILSGGVTFETFVLPFYADVPLNLDANANSAYDFFEASQAISTTTDGVYQDPTDPESGATPSPSNGRARQVPVLAASR